MGMREGEGEAQKMFLLEQQIKSDFSSVTDFAHKVDREGLRMCVCAREGGRERRVMEGWRDKGEGEGGGHGRFHPYSE